MNKHIIKKFEIMVGQDAFRLHPVNIMFILDEHYITCELKLFKKWIDTILDSNGNRNTEAYLAKERLEQFFRELLQPYFVLPEPPKTSNE